ncbi:unnamed protein product [Triticum turgidum subsp. durum]|uniref:AP2/ERF domain-containing protein n=1 Tax=Triticum turgidum subsp. durum TaxID=4567 RepID=A0A9R1QGU0_TRITD|nr:unnamed protein product [Triticum turgidum subsp. durum]
MPLNKLMKGKTRFFGVRAKPSGHFSVKFSDVGDRFWLGTYPIAHEVMCAYDVAVRRAKRPETDLKFSEIKTRMDAEMFVP